MQAEKQGDQHVTQVAEAEFFIGPDQEAEEQKDQGVFQQPVGHVGGAQQGIDPNGEKNYDREDQPDIPAERYPVGR